MGEQTEPRKLPRQQRAQQTVKRILDAASELIAEHGLDELSTNKIAEAANVNISSLYQYFPNKEAIVVALVDANLKNTIKEMDAALDKMQDLSGKEATRRWLNLGLSLYRQSNGLFPGLLSDFSSSSRFPGVDLLEKRLMEAARRFLMRRADKVTVTDLNVGLYVAFNAAMMVLAKHVFDPNSYLTDEEVVNGISEMIVRYMEG